MSVLEKITTSPQNEQEHLARRLLQELYKGSLYKTAKYLLGYSEINEHAHGEIIRTLESTQKRKLIVCPRGTFKSTICVVSYTIWTLLRDPNARILIDSEVFTNSSNFLREIKAHLESPKLTYLFGEFKSDENWTNSSITIKQRQIIKKEPSVKCSGVMKNQTGQHYDVMIHDDMNSDKNSATQEGRQKVIDHYRLNTSILEPNGTIVVVGTRYSSDDLIGFILENELGLRSDGTDFK